MIYLSARFDNAKYSMKLGWIRKILLRTTVQNNLNIFGFIGCLFLFVQSHSLGAQTIESIKLNADYIWGEGLGSNLLEADQRAMADLISQISTRVESEFRSSTIETGKTLHEEVNLMVKSYAAATLTHTERIVEEVSGETKVFRFLPRTAINDIFNERAERIKAFVEFADGHLKRLEIGSSLKYYHWAYSLLRSHPEQNKLKIHDANGTEHLLMPWLYNRLEEVLSGVQVKLVDSTQQGHFSLYQLEFLYRGQMVHNLDFDFWNGRDWKGPFTVKNGKSLLEYPGKPDKFIKLEIEYGYIYEAVHDKELYDLLQNQEVLPLKARFKQIALNVEPALPNIQNGQLRMEGLKDWQEFQAPINAFVKAVETGRYAEARPFFTEEGYDKYLKLIAYGKAKILKGSGLQVVPINEGYMCRAIPMHFGFSQNFKSFTEEVVLHFDENRKICNLTFALNAKAIQDINEKAIWNAESRLLLVHFLEQYQTAYALKQLDYIESVFSNDALIIVGSVLKSSMLDNPYAEHEAVKYTRYTKAKFLENLKQAFAAKSFINIRFEDSYISKAGNGKEVYGVQIKQHYVSSNYADSGYLFLLVDFDNPKQPLIHVRTWQPKRNSDGSIYGLNDF